MDAQQDYIPIAALAKKWGLSVRSIRRLIVQRELSAFRPTKRKLLVSVASAQALIARRTGAAQ